MLNQLWLNKPLGDKSRYLFSMELTQRCLGIVTELAERACEKISECESILRGFNTQRKRTVDQKHLLSAKVRICDREPKYGYIYREEANEPAAGITV